MALKDRFNHWGKKKSWEEKVLDADQIWAQVKATLAANNQPLPATPRRPDVRLIIENVSGSDVEFQNPGDHSGSKPEHIPAAGDSCAVMVMVKGATLEEQNKNAQALYDKYDLGANGLSKDFVSDLKAGKLADVIDEAYGPAPFQGQTDKLADVTWATQGGASSTITPEKGAHASFGARAATNETVFLAQFPIHVKGTNTVAELVESAGINIAVSADYDTGAETTKPIVPSVSKVYYGEHFDKIPSVTLDTDGTIKEIDLKNGTIIKPTPPSQKGLANQPKRQP